MMYRYKPKKVLSFSWSANMAYVVGLITTDGCLSSDKRHVIFTSQDMEQVLHVKSILNSKNIIGVTKNKNLQSEAYRIQIGNVQLYDWLLSIGLTSNKSLTLGAVLIPDNYFIDFLRGHLDGDGSITTYIDKYNTQFNKKYIYQRLCIRFISGSLKHIEWLRTKITDLTGVKGKIHSTKPNLAGNSMYILKFGKKESIIIIKRIYYSNNIPCLSRKRVIAEKFINKKNT